MKKAKKIEIDCTDGLKIVIDGKKWICLGLNQCKLTLKLNTKRFALIGEKR